MEVNLDFAFRYTHQPYLCQISNKKYLFFCFAENLITTSFGADVYQYAPWNIAYCEWFGDGKVGEAHKLITGLNPQDIECSPYVWEKDGKVAISYIGGKFDAQKVCSYHIYEKSGKNLEELSRTEAVNLHPGESVFAGFKNEAYEVLNWQELETEVTDKAGVLRIFYPQELEGVRRIIGVPLNPTLILITGRVGNAFKSFLYDLKLFKCLGEVQVNRRSIYKCCIWENEIIFAMQGNSLEERRLFWSDSFNLVS